MTKELFFRADKVTRLDELLREKLPDALGAPSISNAKIRRLIMAGAVRVEGLSLRVPAKLLKKGNAVSASVDEAKFFYERQNDDAQFELTERDVLYEDDDVIVVNKPPRFPTERTVAGKRDNMYDAVLRYLAKKMRVSGGDADAPPYAGIMHRLDRDTSGCLLFTKNKNANRAVHALFEKREIKKTYRAVAVTEKAASDFPREFSVEGFIAKTGVGKWGLVSEADGKLTDGKFSRTDFTTLGEGARCGAHVLFVEARPLTGRTHQIRVHLASRGMPILGDEVYGGKSKADRLYLHALSLAFPRPSDGTTITVCAPLPKGFA